VALSSIGKTNLFHDGLNPDHVLNWWVNNPTVGELWANVGSTQGPTG